MPLVPTVRYTGPVARGGISVQALDPRLSIDIEGHATFALREIDPDTVAAILWGGSVGATFRVFPWLAAVARYDLSLANGAVPEGGTVSDTYHSLQVGAIAEL
jgi:hypothetical protein